MSEISRHKSSKSIDDKINELMDLCNTFMIIEYYTHSNCDMYKICNPFTDYNEHKLVLCPLSEGIEKALDLAIEEITIEKNKYFGNNK